MKTAPGVKVGPYTLRALLGRGGQGEVWRADGPQGAVAVKLVLHRSPELVLRAWREARLQARVRSPHVVQVLDTFLHEEVPVLVMELVDGPSLKELLRHGRATLAETDQIAEGLFAAVHEAHRQGLLHRDLKPANVLLGQADGGLLVKLTDFGVAREQESWARGGPLTLHGIVVGTPGYIAPEQVTSSRPPDVRADVFALGAMLYKLVTGRRAFHGPTPIAVLSASMACDYESVQSLRSDARERWCDAIAWALQPEPAARAPSVEVLRDVWRGDAAAPPPPAPEGEETAYSTRETSSLLDTLGGATGSRALVGRTHQMLQIRQRLLEHAVVTIWGSPGIGKSHLAREIARSIDTGAPRVAQLAEIQEASGVIVAMAHALGVPLGGEDARARVTSALAASSKGGLLVLDNAEHVIQPLREILDEVVDRGTPCQFLVTSRHAVGARDEAVVHLGGLEVDDAITLFLRCARRATASTADLETIREIVQTVDCNPLAIVLAGSNVGSRPLGQVAFELGERTSSNPRASDPMGAALDWSWDLLSPHEKHALAQCSVFQGGFTLEAAASVLDLSAWPEPPPVADLLAALLDHALVDAQADESGITRLHLSAAVQRHAAAKMAAPFGLGLDVPGELTGAACVTALRHRHALWFAHYGDASLRSFRRTESGMADAIVLHSDVKNLAAALEHVIEANLTDVVAPLGDALTDAVLVRGPMLEGAALVGQALTVRLKPRDQVRLLLDHGTLLERAGKAEASKRQLERAGRVAQTTESTREAAQVELHLANFDYQKGDLARSRDRAQAVLDRLGTDEPDSQVLAALRTLGCSLQYLGDLDGADEAFGRSNALAAAWEYPVDEALAQLHLGSVAKARDDAAGAEAHYEAALQGARRTGRRELEARMQTNLGLLADDRGDPERATACLEAALAICRELGNAPHEALAAGNLGGILVRLGRLDEAEPLLHRAVQLTEHTWPVASGAFRASLGRLHAHRGDYDAAFDLLDQAEDLVRNAHNASWMGVVALRAEIALEIGRDDLARSEVDRLRKIYEGIGVPGDLARIREQSGAPIRALIDQAFSR